MVEIDPAATGLEVVQFYLSLPTITVSASSQTISPGSDHRPRIAEWVLWRISNYADLKGISGLRAPGRLHFAGQPVVYLAEHPAGALLETLVHQEISSTGDLPDTYQLLKVEVDDSVTIAEFGENVFSPDWRDNTSWTQDAGTAWLTANTSALLKVPSAAMPFASNYIMNPAHEDAKRISTA